MKTIKKGQEFKCVKDYVMDSGAIACKAGKNYKSEIDECLKNELGIKHRMTLDDEFYEHFELVESNLKTEIEIPAGCKIAKTEIIDGKLIVTYERDLPENYYDIPDRNYITGFKSTSKKRAEAILALGQLIELAAYVGVEDFNFQFEFGTDKAELARDFYKKYIDLFKKIKI